jgi:hypothetical protein
LDETPQPLASGAGTRFIDQSTSDITYVARQGPNGDREEIRVTGDSVHLGPSTIVLELTATTAHEVSTLIGRNGADGRIIHVRLKTPSVTLKNAAGNLQLSADFVGGKGGYGLITLMYLSYIERWLELSRSGN